MPEDQTTTNVQGWVSHALALSLQGQGLADIALQVGKSEQTVAQTMQTAAFQRQLQLKMVQERGSLRAVVDSLLKDSAIPIVQNLINLAKGSGQHAIRAASMILPRILGDNMSGLNLDTSSAQSVSETVEKLKGFLAQNPAIKAQVLGVVETTSPQRVENDESDSPPEGQPSNVVPILRAVQPPRGGEASGDTKPQQLAL